MYYVTGVSDDLSLYEITCCLTRNTCLITAKQFNERDDIFQGGVRNKYYSCTETPDEGELDILKEEYKNGIKHIENDRYFLFIPISEVKHISKPVYVIVRRKGDGFGPWKLYMLRKTDRGNTRVPEQAYQTEDKGDAIRKANSINDHYAKNKWAPANYTVMTLKEAIVKMKEDEKRY